MSKFTLPAVSSPDVALDEAQGQSGGDRASTPEGSASNGHIDAFHDLLERTWQMLNRPKIHSHVCQHCHIERICCQQPCAYRATDLEREWDCGCQRT